MTIDVLLEYQELILSFTYDEEDAEDIETARRIWTKGPYGCDCTRSRFLVANDCGDITGPLPCGGTIQLLSVIRHWVH